ncbi:MAG TPA: STAS domain-containing protein [Gaiellales bacterium]|nr:STAS domain-containing protein [Gaiellales bacterium]
MHEVEIAVDLRDGVPLVRVHGEHDVSNQELLRDGLATALAQGSVVVVDLSEASFVDSSVLHTLASAGHPARDAPGRAIVVCARGDGLTRRLLHLAGLDEGVPIAETVEDALRSATAEPVA